MEAGMNGLKNLSPAATAAAALLLMLGSAPAMAGSLITNGDFETSGGSLDGWTVAANVKVHTGADYHPCCLTVGSEPAYSNNHFAAFGDGDTTGTNVLSQDVSFLAGHTYELTFDSGALGSGEEALSVSDGAMTLGTIDEFADDDLDFTFSPRTIKFVAGPGAD